MLRLRGAPTRYLGSDSFSFTARSAATRMADVGATFAALWTLVSSF